MPEQEQKILHVEIDRAWTANEFSEFLRSATVIYGLCSILTIEQQSLKETESEMERSGFDPFWFRRLPARLRATYRVPRRRFPAAFPSLIDVTDPSVAAQLLEPEEQLYVSRIQFGSPGFVDFAGCAAVLVPLLPFLFKLIELASTRERRREEDRKIRIENVHALLGLIGDLKNFGFSTVEIRKIINSVDAQQGKLLDLCRARQNSERQTSRSRLRAGEYA
jgi:hypothetical protein